MQTKAILGLVMTAVLSTWAMQAFAWSPTSFWAKEAVADDEAVRDGAIQALRKAGPEGLNALLKAYPELLAQHAPSAQAKAVAITPVAGGVANGQAQADEKANPAALENAELDAKIWLRLKVALDAVGGQKDNHTARLFWYTDLEAAKAAAKASGKPILSLRLLGKLTDELSCANSRFFRTILYPNVEINKALRENYILHWETFRNVPIVTIDFGDGRKIVRTLTGNSIHYVLDSEGRPIDAIPGLYGPAAFLHQLQAAKDLNDKIVKADGSERTKILRAYHAEQDKEIVANWSKDLRQVGIDVQGGSDGNQFSDNVTKASAKQASQSVKRSPSASATSNVMLAKLTNATSDDVWQQVAMLHYPDAQLDFCGVAAVKEKAPPDAAQAGRLADSKRMVELPWMKMVRNLQDATALDTVKNEYTFHRQIHEWFAQGQVPDDLHALNERVYAQLFLMPSTDPWLGLSTPDQFSGITNGGLVETQTAAVEKN